jgi:hypothetical protein
MPPPKAPSIGNRLLRPAGANGRVRQLMASMLAALRRFVPAMR